MNAKEIADHYRLVVQEEQKEYIESRYRDFENLRDNGTVEEMKEALASLFITRCSRQADREEIALHVEAIEDHLQRIKELLT